jgi:hypothetical protein
MEEESIYVVYGMKKASRRDKELEGLDGVT